MSANSEYGKLVARHRDARKNQPKSSAEDELDGLIVSLEESKHKKDAQACGADGPDPIDTLRQLTITEFIPIFVELVEKYGKTGLSMQMDASNFLQGGREIRFDFGMNDHRSQLMGTVTSEAIAFHETRFSQHIQGELVSGPMLRIRGLTGETFRNFVCQRLGILLRAAMRRH